MKIRFLLCVLILISLSKFGAAQTKQLERMWYTAFPDNYQSELMDVAVDAQGFIYATGQGYRLFNSTSDDDWFTVKLNPVTGDTIWTRIYNRQRPPAPGSWNNDYAKKIAVDQQGNIYVGGASHVLQGTPQTYEFVIIKYSPDGDVLWIAESGDDYITYRQDLSSGRFDMSLDPSGNIYVGSGGTLVKFGPTGQVMWGVNNGILIQRLAIDSEKNVIVTGIYSTKKYSYNGSLLWTIPNEGTCSPSPLMWAITIDSFDDVYVGGFACINMIYNRTLRKYSKSGQVLWTVRIPTVTTQSVNSLLLDGSSYLYAGGGSQILKYTTDGSHVWTAGDGGRVIDFFNSDSLLTFSRTVLREYDCSTGNLSDTAAFLTNSADYQTLYNSVMVNHQEQQIISVGVFNNWIGTWEQSRFITSHSKQLLPINPGDISVSFILDSIRINFEDASIIETGYNIQRSSNSGSSWTNVVTLPSYNSEYPFRVLHTIHNSVGGTGNLFRIAAFNNNGQSDWVANNGVKYPSAPTEITADFFISSNSVTLNWKDNSRIEEGYLIERRIGDDALFQQIGETGANIVEFVDDQLPAPILGEEYFYRIRAYTGNVYSDYSDVAVVAVVPVELVSFTASVSDQAVKLSWVTASETNNQGFEIERTSPQPSPYEGEGVEPWVKIGFVEGSGTTTESNMYNFIDPLIGTDGEVTKGKYQYRLKQIDFDGTFEYSDVVEVDVDFAPREYSLEQNYPNPFNPVTKISWQSPVGSRQTIKVYDVLGNEITTLVDEFREAGKYDVEFNSGGLSSGVYFYRLQTDNYINIKKMILMK